MFEGKTKLLRIREVQVMLGCSRAHVYRLFKAGKLAKTVIGETATRVSAVELDRFIERCEQQGGINAEE